MRIALFVSAIDTEQPDYTTTRIAMSAAEGGHEVLYVDLDGVSYQPDDRLQVRARRAVGDTDISYDVFLDKMRDTELEYVDVGSLDALMLRHEPEVDVVERPWTQSLGIAFGEMAVQRGVVVLNDPAGFARAINKLYLQDFPSHVRPRTLITRSADEAKSFIEDLGSDAIVKPLQSGKGEGVFLVRTDENANLNQIIEAVRRDGYLVVQEFLEEATDGDVRMLLMNGEPMMVDDHVAAVRRSSPSDDVRSNISAGGEAEPAEVTDEMLAVAAAVKPKLVRDGMFLVGLDIAGDKLIEVNGTSPGTITSTQWTTGIDYAPVVVEAIEHKVELKRRSSELSNAEIATR